VQRKTSSTPTKIYTYGCLPPIEGADKLDEQLWLAHRYRNKLVEIERRRRERIAQVQREHDVLGDILEVAHSIETAVAEARRKIRLLRSGKANTVEIAAQRELVEALFGDLAVVRFFLARARAQAKTDETLKAAYTAVEQAARDEIKSLRASDEAPYWGTYLVVEKAAEMWRKSADPPRFFRYTGEGRVVVQIQSGMTKAEVESGEDTRLRIGAGTPRVSKSGRVQTAVRPEFRTVRIRVGSDGRAPVWAALPFVMHRSPPDDASIKWAWVIRKRIGMRYKYELQLTVEAESFAPRCSTSTRRIAIDIGARELSTGETRAAMWLDDNGDSGEMKSSLTRLSSSTSHGAGRRRPMPNNLDKVEDLRGIRDRHLDTVKIAIAGYRKRVNLDWLQKHSEYVTLWRSPARVAILYRKWQRHDGDSEIYDTIDAYLRQDRHLLDWESRERSRTLNRRREQYRTFAVRIAETYGEIVLARRDYRRAEWAPEDAQRGRGTRSRQILRGAAPGELCEEIKLAAKSWGVRVTEIALEGDTAWALDTRVCERLLASAAEMAEQAPSLARRKPQNHVNSIEPRSRRRLGTAEKIDPLATVDVID
jgi:hypothetical protein